MERKLSYRIILAVLIAGLMVSCTKSQVRTNKLVNQGRWIFTLHEIGKSNITQYPKWEFSESPIDKEFVQATWTHYDGSSCLFKWRFDYYEGSFSFMVDPDEVQDSNAKAYIQCSNLAGSYVVLTEKKKMFEFESEVANGYPGVRVFIQIQPI